MRLKCIPPNFFLYFTPIPKAFINIHDNEKSNNRDLHPTNRCHIVIEHAKIHPEGCRGPGSNPRSPNTKREALCLHHVGVYTTFVFGGGKHRRVIRMEWPTRYHTHLHPDYKTDKNGK